MDTVTNEVDNGLKAVDQWCDESKAISIFLLSILLQLEAAIRTVVWIIWQFKYYCFLKWKWARYWRRARWLP